MTFLSNGLLQFGIQFLSIPVEKRNYCSNLEYVSSIYYTTYSVEDMLMHLGESSLVENILKFKVL